MKDDSKLDGIEYNGDPESVAHLSQEEKKELTQRLMTRHQSKFKDLNFKQQFGGGK